MIVRSRATAALLAAPYSACAIRMSRPRFHRSSASSPSVYPVSRGSRPHTYILPSQFRIVCVLFLFGPARQVVQCRSASRVLIAYTYVFVCCYPHMKWPLSKCTLLFSKEINNWL
ncbi:hypothetical protein B0H13DRAFT_8908 [Mycena leptocephala]|nr:hypothetical protein B0H13DRAFT_8908 [Mycena leptocephala]